MLLKNAKGALPLKGAPKLAVVGPLADDASGLKSDYEGAGDDNTESIYAALARANTGGSTVYSQGVSITGSWSAANSSSSPAIAAVGAAEVVVLVVGLTKAQEHEGMDRKDTLLPAGQAGFAASIFAAAGSTKPVIVILCNVRPVDNCAAFVLSCFTVGFHKQDYSDQQLKIYLAVV